MKTKRIKHIFEIIKENDYIALNGTTGEIYLNPTETEKEELKQRKEKQKRINYRFLEKFVILEL